MKLYIFMLRTRFFFTRRWAESSAWHMAVNRGRWQSWFMPRSSINHVDPQRSIDHNLFSSSSRLQTKTIPPSISIEISSGGVLIEWILNIKKKKKKIHDGSVRSDICRDREIRIPCTKVFRHPPLFFIGRIDRRWVSNAVLMLVKRVV